MANSQKLCLTRKLQENFKNIPDSSDLKDGYFTFGLSFELRHVRS